MKILSLGFFIFLVSVIANARSLQERLQSPMVAAHRGGMTGSSSNTLEQFEKTRVEGAATILEMDIRLTRDGVPVVFHDEDLDKRTVCSGSIASYVFADLLRCPLKRSGHFIPSFESVLKWNKGRMILNAEFKTLQSVVPAIELVQKYAAYDSVYFQVSSSREEYAAARSFDKKIALLFKPLNSEDLHWILALQDSNMIIIELRDQTVTLEFISKAHAAGKLVSANSFQMSLVDEALGAACDLVFKKGLDIAVTNKPAGCAQQKKYFPKRPAAKIN